MNNAAAQTLTKAMKRSAHSGWQVAHEEMRRLARAKTDREVKVFDLILSRNRRNAAKFSKAGPEVQPWHWGYDLACRGEPCPYSPEDFI